MLDYPRLDDAFRAQALRPGAWRVQIKRRQQISTVTYPYNALDAVGWHGSLMPVRINVKDIRPLMSPRYHLPPSAHTQFVAQPCVLCTFVPQPFQPDPVPKAVVSAKSGADSVDPGGRRIIKK